MDRHNNTQILAIKSGLAEVQTDGQQAKGVELPKFTRLCLCTNDHKSGCLPVVWTAFIILRKVNLKLVMTWTFLEEYTEIFENGEIYQVIMMFGVVSAILGTVTLCVGTKQLLIFGILALILGFFAFAIGVIINPKEKDYGVPRKWRKKLNNMYKAFLYLRLSCFFKHALIAKI